MGFLPLLKESMLIIGGYVIQFPSIQQNAQGNKLTKRKCLLWLIALEFPVCDWLALLRWAAGTATMRHDLRCMTEKNCSCNSLETNKLPNKQKVNREESQIYKLLKVYPQWPKDLLWALPLKVLPLSTLSLRELILLHTSHLKTLEIQTVDLLLLACPMMLTNGDSQSLLEPYTHAKSPYWAKHVILYPEWDKGPSLDAQDSHGTRMGPKCWFRFGLPLITPPYSPI